MDVVDFESTSVIPSVCARPNEQNRMMSVSGVFRTTFTYAVPSQLSIGTGDNRIAARIVPRTSAPIADNTVNWIVVKNAPRTSYSLPASSSNSGPPACSSPLPPVSAQQAAGAGGAGAASPAGPRFLSQAAFHAPSDSIFLMASVTLVHSS